MPKNLIPILFKPRNIVSGDYYFFKENAKWSVLAVADCTGHGIPGAFLSMLGISFLNEIVNDKENKNAAQILEELREKVKTSLKQSEEGSVNQDGMDMAVCVFNKATNILSFSGANNPLYFFRDDSLKEIAATRNPIGIYPKELRFVNNEIQLQKKDRIYMFSDGYMDQFGGDKQGKKFMKKKFRELLTTIHTKPFTEQEMILNATLDKWQGSKHEQTDDILIVGVEI